MTDVSYHVPVLSNEVINLLCHAKQGVYLDATLGGGGHFGMMARMLETGATLIGVDRDPDAVAWNRDHPAASPATIIVEQGRFSEIRDILDRNHIGAIDGALADLGVSSFQIDTSERGFSFMRECELDMRMNPHTGESAADLLDRLSVDELAVVLETYGEVRNAPRMAAALKKAVPLRTSIAVRECLAREYGAEMKYKVLAKVFMALRIAVNDELNELRGFLAAMLDVLADGGRLAVMSYHSLEDLLVKEFFRANEQHCTCPNEALLCTCGTPGRLKRITRKPVLASASELELNPRSRSVRLRVAEKLPAKGGL
jgi:16S rRNA (cytosine1402-N4)-methyltransferase